MIISLIFIASLLNTSMSGIKRIFTSLIFTASLISCGQAKDSISLSNTTTDTPTNVLVTAPLKDSITFFKTKDFEQAIRKAKAEGKNIFIDFTADWCLPCKQMEATTFVNTQVISKLNNKYIALKIDVSFFDGMDIADKYHVKSYPTFLIINSSKSEKRRVTGFQSVSEMLQFLGR